MLPLLKTNFAREFCFWLKVLAIKQPSLLVGRHELIDAHQPEEEFDLLDERGQEPDRALHVRHLGHGSHGNHQLNLIGYTTVVL